MQKTSRLDSAKTYKCVVPFVGKHVAYHLLRDMAFSSLSGSVLDCHKIWAGLQNSNVQTPAETSPSKPGALYFVALGFPGVGQSKRQTQPGSRKRMQAATSPASTVNWTLWLWYRAARPKNGRLETRRPFDLVVCRSLKTRCCRLPKIPNWSCARSANQREGLHTKRQNHSCGSCTLPHTMLRRPRWS